MTKDPLLCFFLLCTFFLCFHGGQPSFSDYCSGRVCNGVAISYPFWKIDDGSNTNGSTQNAYCGYPGFGLSCAPSNDTFPVLALPSDNYYVKHINYASKSVTLIDIDLVGKSCPRAQHNVTIDSLPLDYHQDDVNITFYFNCSIDGVYEPLAVSPIPCLGQYMGKPSYVFLEGEEPEEFDWAGKCEDTVVATVRRTEVTESDLINQFARAMNTGFILDWDTAKECGECESTGGRCGFNNRTKKSLCFCDDGSILTNNSSGAYCKGVGAGVGTAIILVGLFLFLRHRNRRKSGHHSYVVSRSMSSAFSSRTDFEKGGLYCGLPIFDYEELRDATNNFDQQKELGDGGFGTVFHGKLKDGREVAVKRLYENNYKRVEQFMNEVEILARLRHPNLVILYGCTSRQSHRLLLVYEYVPNGTVADHLHGDLAKPGSLPWSTRLNIAIETASALVYLHASDIIHRDVKTNNILLDENFSVKVADFGLSRLFPFNVTHVSTAPQGTPGYVDPEYHQCYQLTEKSDVYSFGVVLMELISSLPAVDIMRHRHEINLSTMAVNKIHTGALHELVDPNLGFESNCDMRKMITAVAELGFQCLQNAKEMRPSMAEVLRTLTDIQKQDSDGEKKAEENDDAVLLKANPMVLSPDSVAVKWVSTSTTPNASS
ncbi:LEAF RUST 10 DISEASE-RESISTANCE LOCUS RECEPTOR-LIKE PROTEIN KINASE-like 1.2 isoform X5 [Punica granatum]|uniref:non-specific serine/threonine protein kinase n=1 Tax=Punica granatum TaxID=22663 RepID=A0A6P8EF97_PUNGR|nr:LEAF RUST 10 DISEASE-RESISTANCE LOCUS RECEPTOR-LIKE PROTEIN KINASE-like 1.2 isoform X5 [Punica granatum]